MIQKPGKEFDMRNISFLEIQEWMSVDRYLSNFETYRVSASKISTTALPDDFYQNFLSKELNMSFIKSIVKSIRHDTTDFRILNVSMEISYHDQMNILNLSSDYDTMIASPGIGHFFESSNFYRSVDTESKKSNNALYEIGMFGSSNLYIDTNITFNDCSILLFNSTKVNVGKVEVRNTDSTRGVMIELAYMVPDSRMILLNGSLFTDSYQQTYKSIIRDKKIDDILN